LALVELDDPELNVVLCPEELFHQRVFLDLVLQLSVAVLPELPAG
jgi:hypothetical protein